jgi:hypothetical protein
MIIINKGYYEVEGTWIAFEPGVHTNTDEKQERTVNCLGFVRPVGVMSLVNVLYRITNWSDDTR